MSSRALLAGCAVLLFVSSLLSYGYRMDGNNSGLQLALVKKLNDPTLFPNDPYAVSLGYYGSPLWSVVARCAKIVPLQPLLFTLFCAERALGITAAAVLARKFAPRSPLAAVSAMALMAWPIIPILGGGTIVKRYFEQTGLSIPFFLLAAAAFLGSRRITCAVLLAVGFNLNSMYGLFAAAYFAAAFAFSESHRREWKRWIVPALIFLALALPALSLGFSLMHHSSGADDAAWMEAASQRSLYHLYPLAFPAGGYWQFSILLGILFLLLWRNRHTAPPLIAQGIAWTLVCCGWLAFAFLAAYVVKKPSLLMLQMSRATDLWLCFASILIVSLASLGFEPSGGNRRIALLIFAVAFIGVVRPEHSLYVISACVAVPLLPLVWRHIFVNGSVVRISLYLAIIVSATQLHTFWSRYRSSTSFTDAVVWRISERVEAIANWVRTHSAKDAVFLVDPGGDEWNHFRELSERSIVTSWEEGSAINWDRRFASEWIRRLHILGYDITAPSNDLDEICDKLTDADIRRISAGVKLDYCVVPEKNSSTFAVVFQSGGYKVLRVN